MADEFGKGDLAALIAEVFGLEDWPKDGAPYYLLTRDEFDEIVSGVDFAPEVGMLADAVWDHLSAARDEHDTARAAGDRAIDVAVALEQENAILRPAVDELTRARADAVRKSGPDPWADVATLRAAMRRIRDQADASPEDMAALPSELTRHVWPGCTPVFIATAALAATDPQRDGS